MSNTESLREVPVPLAGTHAHVAIIVFYGVACSTMRTRLCSPRPRCGVINGTESISAVVRHATRSTAITRASASVPASTCLGVFQNAMTEEPAHTRVQRQRGAMFNRHLLFITRRSTLCARHQPLQEFITPCEDKRDMAPDESVLRETLCMNSRTKPRDAFPPPSAAAGAMLNSTQKHLLR